jgi:hypothetical protein
VDHHRSIMDPILRLITIRMVLHHHREIRHRHLATIAAGMVRLLVLVLVRDRTLRHSMMPAKHMPPLECPCL